MLYRLSYERALAKSKANILVQHLYMKALIFAILAILASASPARRRTAYAARPAFWSCRAPPQLRGGLKRPFVPALPSTILALLRVPGSVHGSCLGGAYAVAFRPF
jgi:hypothetical protein